MLLHLIPPFRFSVARCRFQRMGVVLLDSLWVVLGGELYGLCKWVRGSSGGMDGDVAGCGKERNGVA